VFVRRPQLFDRKGKTDFIAKSDQAFQFRNPIGENQSLSQRFISTQLDDELQSIFHGHQHAHIGSA